jgi:hypothetical protein
MTSAVIAFPAARSRRVRSRQSLDRTGDQHRLGRLDAELLKSLGRRRCSLLMRYRAELRRVREAEALASW